jgi:probable phosphoglycerate mutase
MVSHVESDFARSIRQIERRYLIGVDGATEVLLIRHGDIYQGQPGGEDPQLSPLGRDQATKLAARLRPMSVAAVYTSPLRRAMETARAIDPDFIVEPRLVEAETAVGERSHVKVSEPGEAIVERMAGAVDGAIEAHAGRRVVMIGHGVAILHYLSHVMRLDYGQLRIYPYFTGINVVRALGDRRMVGSLGDIAHLEPEHAIAPESLTQVP